MYQIGKSHVGSFYNFNFDVQFLGHFKNDVIKVTCIEVNIIKLSQNGVKLDFFVRF